MSMYDLHKRLINNYILQHKGDTALLRRDTSRDKRDIDVIREHHRFLWDESESAESWESRLARKYYDKLFKEYCICDLSRYKENRVAMRWRTEQEVVSGKGQFTCGEKRCPEKDNLKSWEVNFAYTEQGEKKNALVKARLCPACSDKLNYHHKKREAKQRKRKHLSGDMESAGSKRQQTETVGAEEEETAEKSTVETEKKKDEDEASVWKSAGQPTQEKSREEEFEEYLADLLL